MKAIPLTQEKVALVDDLDFELVNQSKWCAVRAGHSFYVHRMVSKNGRRFPERLHHFLMPGVRRVDHKDGNGLNNQRENLRPATRQQNGRGFRTKKTGLSSRFRGVSFFRRDGNWSAYIQAEGKKIHLGYFDKEEDAARAYDLAAKKFFGEFACPNFQR